MTRYNRVCHVMLQKAHCNGCMNVSFGLCWGESRGTKPCVCPCKVAAAGDGGYLLCAAGAGWVRLGCTYFYGVLQLNICRSQCNGCVKVAWRRGCMRYTIVFCSWTS